MTNQNNLEFKLLKLIENYLNFPNSQICKHYICLDLISLLEEKEYILDNELTRSICHGDDEASLLLIKDLIKSKEE